MFDADMLSELVLHLSGAAPIVWAAVRGLGKVVAKVDLIEKRIGRIEVALEKVGDLRERVALTEAALEHQAQEQETMTDRMARMDQRVQALEAE